MITVLGIIAGIVLVAVLHHVGRAFVDDLHWRRTRKLWRQRQAAQRVELPRGRK